MATTRSSLKQLTSNKPTAGTTGKRKADGSPGRNDRVKRSALTNLTNQVKQSDSDENLKKVTAFGNKEENALNIKPIGVRTRAAAAAVTIQSKTLKPTAPVVAKKSNENLKLEVQPPTDLLTVLKTRHAEIATKPSTKTRRISNEFEKTEESLYVSALEEIPSDASLRLSDAHRKKSSIGSVDLKPLIHASKTDETIKPDSLDIYEDAQDDDLQRDRKLPPGVLNFDRENWDDPYQVSHYAMDIFDYLTQQEHKYQIRDYINDQPELSKWMRSLLVDWMVEVQESFELNHETLYLSVKIVDSYLGKEKVSKDSLQLVGAAALLIACKYDERTPPLVDDFLFICDGAYKRNQLLKMEGSVFRAINYDLGFPLSYRFLRRYARCGRVSMVVLTLARYILEYSLMDYTTIQLSDSRMAAAALFIALRMNNFDGWDESSEYYSGYKLDDFAPIVVLLNTLMHKKPKETLNTVRNKYGHKIFHSVSKIPLVDVNYLFQKHPDVAQKLALTHLTFENVIASCKSSLNSDKHKLAKEYVINIESLPLPNIR